MNENTKRYQWHLSPSFDLFQQQQKNLKTGCSIQNTVPSFRVTGGRRATALPARFLFQKKNSTYFVNTTFSMCVKVNNDELRQNVMDVLALLTRRKSFYVTLWGVGRFSAPTWRSSFVKLSVNQKNKSRQHLGSLKRAEQSSEWNASKRIVTMSISIKASFVSRTLRGRTDIILRHLATHAVRGTYQKLVLVFWGIFKALAAVGSFWTKQNHSCCNLGSSTRIHLSRRHSAEEEQLAKQS